MKNAVIKLLGGFTLEDISKYNACILNEFQKQGTSDMPFIAYDERVCLKPAIIKAMEYFTNPHQTTNRR